MASDTLNSVNAPEAAGALAPPIKLRGVLAVGVGNALEFYDFLTFSFFAIQIGHSFFPGVGTSHGLLYSLATFGVGFVTRPLGGIVIGIYGDRAGRKPALLLSFALMGIAITGMALIPSAARIGVAAPILLICFRLLQGFALGGEVGPATAFLVEAAPPARRGLYVALQGATQEVALLTAGLVGLGLSSVLTPAALDDWGWRAAFLLGAAVVPFGLMMRRCLPETLDRPDRAAPAPRNRRAPVRLIALSLALLGSATISSYVISYLTTYAQDSLKLSAGVGFGAIIVSGLCSLVVLPLGGMLSDHFGRKPVALTGKGLQTLLAIPAFLMLDRFPSAPVLYAVAAIISIAGSLGSPFTTAIVESLPKAVRSGLFAILYAVAISVFGGSTQFIIKWLIDATGTRMAPAWYWEGALLIGLAVLTLMPESAPIRTLHRSRSAHLEPILDTA